MNNTCLTESLCAHIGETVTIFTTSGGLSGSGFTGILAAVTDNCVKLITDIGGAPNCPLGSNCSCGKFRNRNNGGSCELGSVTVIPLDKISSFTHNAI